MVKWGEERGSRGEKEIGRGDIGGKGWDGVGVNGKRVETGEK